MLVMLPNCCSAHHKASARNLWTHSILLSHKRPLPPRVRGERMWGSGTSAVHHLPALLPQVQEQHQVDCWNHFSVITADVINVFAELPSQKNYTKGCTSDLLSRVNSAPGLAGRKLFQFDLHCNSYIIVIILLVKTMLDWSWFSLIMVCLEYLILKMIRFWNDLPTLKMNIYRPIPTKKSDCKIIDK